MTENRITAVGELLVDFTPCGAAGEYPSFTALPGGAPANFLAAAASYGAGASMLAKVGADSFGKMLKNTLAGAGIGVTGVVEDDSVFTTLAFVTLDAEGERSFSFARKPGADTRLLWEDISLPLIDEAGMLHFGSLSFTDEPSASAVEKAVRYAREKGKIISYDPNYRAPLWRSEKEAVEKMRLGLTLADVVKISGEELTLVTGLRTEDGARVLLERYGCRLVFVTLGKDGCFFLNRQGGGTVGACEGIHPVDTTGAGDIFGGSAAAVILSLGKAPDELRPEELSEICRYACTAAGLSTEKYGGIASVPGRDAVLEKMRDMR